MRRLANLCLASMVLGASGCATSEPGHKLVWRTLSRGLTSGVTAPQRVVVRDEVTYLKLWAQHAADANRMAFPPAVDFTREMVVLVALGSKPTGGYLVEIVDAELRGRRLRLLVGEREPRPGSFQIQHLTQPFQFVALPTMTARVEFRVVREAEATGEPRKARPGEEGPQMEPASPPVQPQESPRGRAARAR